MKLGSGKLQSDSNNVAGKVKIYSKGHADSGKQADAYVDYIKLYDAENQAVFEDNFNTVDTDVWAVPDASGTIGTAYVDNYYLNLYQETTSAKAQTQIAQTGLDLSKYEKFKVEFDAKVNQASSGPGSPDCNTIGVKLVFNSKRLMFTIEDDYLKYTTSGGTWGGITNLDEGAVYDWVHYTLVVDSNTGAAEVYMGETKVADALMSYETDNTCVEIWCNAYSTSPTADSYMDNFYLLFLKK